jgi:hypothetical protein
VAVALCAPCALWSCGSVSSVLVPAAETVDRASSVPPPFQGAWSEQVESCGKDDSDQNYFIGPKDIQAWEVTWTISRTTLGPAGALRIVAIHREYEADHPVVITITQRSSDEQVFEECSPACWQVTLKRCPP